LSDLKIDNSEQTLKVTGKGNKQRIIYLNSAVCEAINAYIKIRPKLDKSNKDYNALFLSSRGKRISKRSVQNIIKSELVELVEAEGKESKKYHTHTLRHTGATLLYNEANANIFVLKIILGHESLDATQVYTHVSDKKLKELMQNFNILDRKE
jgi:integrase/recombinase XerD